MPSITLIGPDGAGKTTLTRMLEASGMLPFRYVYMGVNVTASNFALPTSRLAHAIKRRLGEPEDSGAPPPDAGPARGGPRRGGRLRAAARLLNRLAEEWYRQLIAWQYQLRGYVVLYDRHFIFDFDPSIAAEPTLEKRLHRWILRHLYPRPDLVVFLDAPGEVLYARKGESTAEELERRRQAFLAQGRQLRNFVRVDATRPLDQVYRDVAGHVARWAGARARRPASPEPQP